MSGPHVRALLLSTLLLGTASMVGADTVEIHNNRLRLTIDSDARRITLTRHDGGNEAVTLDHWREEPVELRVSPVADPSFGKGQHASLTARDGSSLTLTLFDTLPFAVVEDTFVNPAEQEQTLSQRVMARFICTGPTPASTLRAFGTFGLSEIDDDNPGSYNHLALVEPTSRRGTVLAWLTHDRGSGVLLYDRADDDAVRVTARQDFGRLRLPPGAREPSEKLLIGFFDDARIGLEQYADAAVSYHNIHLPPQPTVYCTWYHARASNEKQIREQTDFAADHLSPYGFNVVQIDDGWQDGEKRNGPPKVFTRHRPDGPYPSGMKATAEYIESKGLTPGLWLMPFAGTHDDPHFADQQHLFYQLDGKPLDVPWGGTCLDPAVPASQALIRRRIETICRDWGFRYIKIDGVWGALGTPHVYINTAYKDDKLGDASPADPAFTSVQAERTALQLVRDAAGPDTFILGCNLAQNMRTLGISIGLVDAMRVGPDNGPDWKRMVRGPFSGSNLYFLHRRVWYNDPDPVYVRPEVPLEQARALVSWVALTGQLHASSYYFADLPPERLDLLRRAMPSHTLTPRPVDLFDQQTPRLWLLTDDRRPDPFHVVGLFNWSADESVTLPFDPAHIGLPPAPAYVGFDLWADAFVLLQDQQPLSVDPASCRILALRPIADRPQLVSTSRHITQGIIDVKHEHWDPERRTLHGESEIVGQDPYQLRIARPASGQWTLDHLEADHATIQLLTEEPAGWRIQLDTPENRTVTWRLAFK